MVRKDELLRMGRRRFTKTLAGLGVSGAALAKMTKPALAELDYDPEHEVPRLFGYEHTNHDQLGNGDVAPERKSIYYSIPREKWAVVEGAHDARERVSERLRDLPFSAKVGVRTRTSGQRRRKEVVVEHVSLETPSGEVVRPKVSFEQFKERVKHALPDTIDGVAGRGTDAATTISDVPIEIEERRITQQLYYDYEYRNYGAPAGCVIRNPGGGAGTLGTLAHDNDIGKNVMVTAAHVLRDDNGNDYNDVYQNTDGVSGDHLGNVNQDKIIGHGDFDVGVIDDLDISGTYSFAKDSSDSYQGPTIFGSMAKTTLKDYEGDSSYSLRKQGARTGRTSGYIDTVYDTDFRTTIHTEKGDSGSPVFRTSSTDRAYVAGIHGGSASGYGYHTIMESVESEFNLTV